MVGFGEGIPVPTFIACEACKKEVSSEGGNFPHCSHPIAESIDAYRESSALAGEAKASFVIADLSMEMLWVKPGTFEMGSPSSEKNRADDETPHTVTLSQGFYLGKHEVTQSEWEKVMGSNPSHFNGADRPVERVSWTAVTSFCEKLTELERKAGRLPSGMSYQLPT
jgi:formylglycine-generating enzyme required for sulfatase activity